MAESTERPCTYAPHPIVAEPGDLFEWRDYAGRSLTLRTVGTELDVILKGDGDNRGECHAFRVSPADSATLLDALSSWCSATRRWPGPWHLDADASEGRSVTPPLAKPHPLREEA